MAITLGRAAPTNGFCFGEDRFCAASGLGSVQLGGLGRDERYGEDDVLINLADLPRDAGIDGRA